MNAHLTSLLVKLLVPLLTIYSILTVPPQALSELSTILILTILVHLMGPCILYLRLRRRVINNATRGAFYTCVTFNNALFIPLPLVMMFFGEDGVPFVILFSITQLFLFASLGSTIGFTFSEKGISLTQIAEDARFSSAFRGHTDDCSESLGDFAAYDICVSTILHWTLNHISVTHRGRPWSWNWLFFDQRRTIDT